MGEKKLAERGYPSVKVLCLDEIAPHKGHGRYKLIVSAPEEALVLDVLSDRKKESLESWFDERGLDWCLAIEVCCADMWDAYHEAAQAKLPNARQVVDRFHVMKNLTDAVTKARRTIQKQADPATQEALKGCRWLLVKNASALTTDEQQKLEIALAASPELKQCYHLKEAFRHWFESATSRQVADAHLSEWIANVHTSGLKPLLAFTKTLTNWRERILNYFDGRYSNGFAEGINLKIKLLNRLAFGYRNFDNFRLHILVAFAR